MSGPCFSSCDTTRCPPKKHKFFLFVMPCMYVCMYVSIYIAHYRMELNPDLMTLFRFQFGRCDWTHHRMFNVISLKAIKDPCVMRAAFRRRDCYRFLTGSAGFRNQSLIAFFPKCWRSNPLHHHIPEVGITFQHVSIRSGPLFFLWLEIFPVIFENS